MIDVKELRIGNWVSGQNDPEMKVVEISEGSVQLRFFGADEDYGDWSYDDEDLKPIPLTPDILEKCGFDKNKIKKVTRFVDSIDDIDPSDKNKYTYWWDIPIPKNDHVEDLPRFTLVQFGKGTDIFWKYQMLSVKVKYLHQIQNLYYALTGEELEI